MSSLPMAEVSEAVDTPRVQAASRPPTLVCMPVITADALHTVIDRLVTALPYGDILIASPDAPPDSHIDSPHEGQTVRTVPYPPQPAHAGWLLTSADYLAAANMARELNAGTTLLLGPEAASLSAEALHALCAAVIHGADLALPRYNVGPHEGLVNAALLYPLSRALYGVENRMPLTLDAAFSPRMAARFAVVARKASNTANDLMLWPAAEAAVASLHTREVPVGDRVLPHPDAGDLNSLLAQIAGSLFSDLEAKAAFWQRARNVTPPVLAPAAATHATAASAEDLAEVVAMAESFRNAFTNLQEIWSLVVPPQSLLALKKLSLSSPEGFAMPANLWARTVYDFVLAHRLRTINRGHLLGAFTPLYLAWVGSHVRRSDGDPAAAEQHIEETAAAFIAERPYVLARWRWPDRFNP